MQAILKPTAKKIGDYYIGRVKVYDGARYVYTDSVGIWRMNRADALIDAQSLAQEIKLLNCFDGIAIAA